ncbi:DUF4865 family protein [Kribbella sp. CA-293567]|uniref:DUF4865 family protein n=1 Tax=Kribbella sp. CA-293567 TaxID=3002436 RepID=UPI0022DD9908|nr:DUF4865 family protein [Kribbella sp. CA-293567]WBQ05649.1 DUF4865 family protein [Kribbella sp. CA-293567]
MYAMQYELNLPADYDLGIIRRRVQLNGPRTDDFDGLGLKAYLVQDRANGAVTNQYAPFYLWNDTAGMSRFLWGGAFFSGICQSFGRPVVRHWTGAEAVAGPEIDQPAAGATKSVRLLPPDVDPTGPVGEALEELRRTATLPGVHSSAVAVDPTRWELVHFTLWSGEPGLVPGTRYQVLHLSTGRTKALFR